MLEGLWTALPPVYDHTDHEIGVAWGRLSASGVDGIFALGTTGQGTDFSVAERRDCLERLVHCIDRDRLVVAVSANAPADVRELIQAAFALGIKGVALTPPFYGHFSPDEVKTWAEIAFRGVDKTAEVYLYNMPSIGDTLWTISLLSAMDELVGIDGIKDSSGDPHQLMTYLEWARERNVSVVVGDETLTTYAYLFGGRGVISGLSSVYPDHMANLVACCQRKEWDDAARLQRQIDRLLKEIVLNSPRATALALARAMDAHNVFYLTD